MASFITGASGFTGSHVAERLLTLGEPVHIFVRPNSAYHHLEKLGARVFLGDICDAGAAQKAMHGCQTVYHIAALYRQAGFKDEEYIRVNIEGTRTMLDAACAAGVSRFVHCSTMGVHGHITEPPANEDTRYAPGDIYQRTKLEGEKLARSYFTANKINGVVVRPTGIYGPGDMRFLKLFRAIYKKRFIMVGDGMPYYHLVYIDDLVTGFILSAQNKTAAGKVYLIGGKEYVHLKDLVRMIAEILHVPPPRLRIPAWPIQIAGSIIEHICIPLGLNPPIHRRRVDFFTKSRAFSIQKAMTELGYQPSISLFEGLKRTAEWYLQQGLLS